MICITSLTKSTGKVNPLPELNGYGLLKTAGEIAMLDEAHGNGDARSG